MKMAYYPGCSLDSTAIEFNMSTKTVARAMGLELWEIPNYTCCGASSGHVTDHLLTLALPARNLAIAEEQGLDVAIPCAACYIRMKAAEVAVKESGEMRDTLQEVTGRKYEGKIKAKNLLDVFANDVGLDKIKVQINRPLTGLKTVCYYGCLIVRPPKISQFDDPEDPVSMDSLMEASGAETLYWGYKTECCGASHIATMPKIGIKMIEPILKGAVEVGADCIVVACPICMANLDMRQKQLGTNIPVFYFTELLGLALGFDANELGINKHFVDPMPLLKHKGLLHPVKREGDVK